MNRLVQPQLLALSATQLNWQHVVQPAATGPLTHLMVATVSGTHDQTVAAQRSKLIVDSMQLRWLTTPDIGLPLHPFKVWARPSGFGGVPQQTRTLNAALGSATPLITFNDAMAMVELDINFPAAGGTAFAIALNSQGQPLDVRVATGSGPHSLVLKADQIISVVAVGLGVVTTVKTVRASDFAALPNWQLVELVGLPVQPKYWLGTGYDLGPQGLAGQPLAPPDAGLRRLDAGGPPIGWSSLTDIGLSAPTWVAPDHPKYLAELEELLMPLLAKMLLATGGDPAAEMAYSVQATIPPPQQQGGTAAVNAVSSAGISPLGIALMAAGSDPFASLALGFGTALARQPKAEGRHDFMVTLEVRLGGIKFELADFVIDPQTIAGPSAPTNLSASLRSRIRPQARDGDWTEAVDLTWDRTQPLLFTLPRVASYGVVRFTPPPVQGEVLLHPRAAGGWDGFAPSRPTGQLTAAPVVFSDGYVALPAASTSVSFTHSVTAQDLFGRWSPWRSTSYGFHEDGLTKPAIVSANLDVSPNGAASTRSASLTLDFVWDWSDRSPEYVDFVASWVEPPPDAYAQPPVVQPVPTGFQLSNTGATGNPLRVAFGGSQYPTVALAGATVVGTDALPVPDDVRHYRLTVPNLSIDFAGHDAVHLTLYARGAEHLRPALAGDWTRPTTTTAFSPVPPAAPTPPDPILWTSLPDVSGMARAHLKWTSTGAFGYAVYEATESALLEAVSLPGPDLTKSYAERLATLRTIDLGGARSAFRRQNDTLFTVAECEIRLPRGSAVIHAYVITSMSSTNVESEWPSGGFFAVATPRLSICGQPSLAALAASATTPQADVLVRARSGMPVTRIELFRTLNDALATDVDMMGPPISSTDGPDWTLIKHPDGSLASASYTDQTVTPGWRSVWYRAVAWSADDDQAGLVASRSVASPAMAVVIPPTAAAALANLTIATTAAGDKILSWDCNIPVVATPLGPHMITVTLADPSKVGGAPLLGARSEANATQRRALAGLPQPGTIFRLSSDPAPDRWAIVIAQPTGIVAANATVTFTDPLGRMSQASSHVTWP